MTRVLRAWRTLAPEQRLAVVAAGALLVTMFFPWYGLQAVDRKTGAIYTHDISAFGDVSFVEAAIFLVAAGVVGMEFARGEGRDFRLPGGDGAVVMGAGLWAALLIFYRVFSRPAGNGLPVGIEWGFFLAFVAAGGLAYAGWRMRTIERTGRARGPRRREHGSRAPSRRRSAPGEPAPGEPPPSDATTREPPHATTRDPSDATTREEPFVAARPRPSTPPRGPAPTPVAARERSPFPPAPEQLSFEDPPEGG
jgi:hypothetical protein